MTNGASGSTPSSSSTPTPNDRCRTRLLAHCRRHLAAYKCPRSIEFREDLPRTEAGKLYKRRIRDEYWTGTGRQI